MKRALLFVFAMTLTGYSLQAQLSKYALPKVENGQWYIVLGQKKIKLPISYNYVHYFDNTGHAYFCSGSKYGIIDSTGKEKVPAKHIDILQYGDGLFRYANEKGYLLHSLKTQTKTPCSWSKLLAENWIYYKQEGSHFLLHTSWKEPLVILNEKSIQKTLCNYLYVQKYNLQYSLFLPNGQLLEENPEIVNEEYDALYVKGSKNHFIVTLNGKLTLPISASNIRIRPNYFTYCYKEKVHLIETEENKEILVASGDDIVPFKNKFILYKNNRAGLLDANGKQIFAPIYRNFYELQGNYVVNLNGNVGMINEEGKLLIPCIYQTITLQGEYYKTSLFTGTCGLISAINYEEILTPYYTKITTDGPTVRAWDNNRLVLVELEKDHREKNRLYINNVISMNLYKDLTNLKNFDQRLFSVGWYYTSKTSVNEEKKTRNTKYLWGLEAGDTVRIKAHYRTPTFVENANFSLVPSKKLEEKLTTKLLGTIDIGLNKFGNDAFNFTLFKPTNKNCIIALDSTDFYTKEFARIHTTKSFGIISKSGITHELLFIDDAYNGYSRYCQTGEVEKNKEKKGNVKIPNFLLNTGYVSRDKASAKIQHGTWNYFNAKGDSLFQEPFLYASNFYKKTAIVQRKKGFGVIRDDSVIIPTLFSSIQRVPLAKDTLFLVNRARNFTHYLDSNLRILPFSGLKILQTHDSLRLVQHENTYQLLTLSNKVVETSSRMYYLINKHYVMHKEGKEYVIRNSKLDIIGKSVLKPISFLDETHFLVENHERNAVFNLAGDTIIGFENKYLEHKNGFLCAYGNGSYITIYNEKLKQIVRKRIHQQIDITEDFLKKYIAITINQKVFVYNQSGIQVAKIALAENELSLKIYHKLLLTSTGRFINFEGQCVNEASPQSGYNWVDSSYFVYVDKYDKWHVMTAEGKERIEEPLLDANYLGEDVFSYEDTNKNFILFDARNNQKYLYVESVKGSFSDGFLLVQIDGKYEYVDRNFQNVFQKSFDDAHPFTHGMAAIKIDKNWTLIGKHGFQKALPTFNFIEHKGLNLYSIETHNYYGVYDSHGNVIVEPTYLSVQFLDAGIIQATKLGVIEYFTMDGRKIE